jgi:hypothetical protein
MTTGLVTPLRPGWHSVSVLGVERPDVMPGRVQVLTAGQAPGRRTVWSPWRLTQNPAGLCLQWMQSWMVCGSKRGVVIVHRWEFVVAEAGLVWPKQQPRNPAIRNRYGRYVRTPVLTFCVTRTQDAPAEGLRSSDYGRAGREAH